MKRSTALILLLFTLSGVSGLIYEIAWIRLLSHLLGGTSFAISTVLAAFMGGLALGSRYFGDRADHTRGLLQIYARLEFGIAALGALAYVIIHFAPPIYVALASNMPPAAVAVLRVMIAMLLLLPPTFLMGGTLPILSRFVVRRPDRLGRGLGLLYAVNTFGAVVGCFLAGFVLIPGVGLLGSVAIAVGLNLLIGFAVLAVAGRLPSPREATTEPVPAETSSPKLKVGGIPFGLLGAIFALSGFASLGYELYWTKALQHFLGNSTYAFSAMLTTFLLGLSMGGWLGGRLADRSSRPAALLGWVQIGVGASALLSVLLIWGWLPGLGESDALNHHGLGWNGYLMQRFLIAFLVMALPTLLTGMTFPIVSRIGISGLDRLGHRVGRLYFLNTLGSIVGSLAAGFLILPLLSAKGALVGTALLSAGLGLFLHYTIRRSGTGQLKIAAGVLVALIVAAPLVMGFGRSPLSDSQDPQDLVLFETEDHAAETKVYRKSSGDMHMSVDGYRIGGTDVGILPKEKILAHLPLALRPNATRTLSVGLGTGITLGTLAMYSGLEHLDCVEIVPGVVEGAAFFAASNRNVLHDSRVHIHVGDGVQFLLTTSERYDIISSDSKLNPEYAGNGPLLSLDYYELCRDRLSDDGVMVQWLACHLPVSELEVIVRSFFTAFEHVAVFWLSPSNLILAGSGEPLVLDLDAVRDHAREPGPGTDLRTLQLENPYVMAGLFLADKARLEEIIAEGPLNTWARPRIEFTMLKEYRRKSSVYHGADNLRWMKKLSQRETLATRGKADPATLEKFRTSSQAVMEGYAASGNLERIGLGKDLWIDALQKNPEDVRLVALIEQANASEAAEEKAFSSSQVNDPNSLAILARTRMDQKRYEEALTLLDRVCTMDNENRGVLFNRLLVLKALKRTVALKTELAEFNHKFPKDARGVNMRGRLAADAQHFEEAIEFFQSACELDPVGPIYLNNLATTYVRLERYGEAGAAYANICDIQPDFPSAGFNASACCSMAGQTAHSAEWMHFCLEHDLAKREQFETNQYFVNLRESEHWPH
ncbi:MAG: fused MFS/spermidine synthase [Gemmatimonadales bacterium]|nr:fused MFS/spermidine synthase [Gemmatimonadales bacterium]